MHSTSTANSPLTSNDQSKLLIFALLLAPSVIFGVGVIPAILLIFGIYMLKRNQDFSHIDVAFKNFRRFTILVLIVSLIWSVLMSFDERTEWFAPLIFLSVPAMVYYFAVEQLFYRPLKSRYLWVEQNGIFSSRATELTKTSNQVELDIVKGERLKQYSVADELLKWAKLKDEGHITEDEFKKARAELLKKD